MSIQFLAPSFLWLALAIPLLALWSASRRDWRHFALRALPLALLVLALARPITTATSEVEHSVFVLDASDSVDPADVAQAGERLAAWVAALPEQHRTSLIQIGSSATPIVEAEFDHFQSFAGEVGSPLGASLEAALQRIPQGARGSITLLSDGWSTTRDWARASEACGLRGIPLHSFSLNARRLGARPVRLERPPVIRVGQTVRLTAIVIGEGTDLTIRLSSEGEELTRVDAVGCAGHTRIPLEFEPARAGFLPLSLELSNADGSASEAFAESSKLDTVVAVQDPLRVLYFGERVAGGAPALQGLLGAGFQLDFVANPEEASELGQWDLAWIDDRPSESLPDAMQQRLVDAVVNQGTGLVMSGGAAAFGPGGYHQSPVSSVLPVEFVQKEEKRDPSTTLVVVIDTSGSMGGNRVQLAKEVTRLSMRRLLPHDKCGIVEFYGAKRWAAPIQPASNTIELQRALNRLDAGGGTVILPAIEEAFYGLQNVRTRYKHVLVLTDGGVETGAFEPLLRKMADKGINVSTVLIGGDAHSEFLVNLANWGKGRFYSVPNRFSLPEVILKQPTGSRLPAYKPGTHNVRARGGSGWWHDIDRTTVPALRGYVEARARPGAEVLLETQQGAHPVLSSWRYGLGRVTSLMTEPTGPGTENWRDWEGYGPFLARVLSRTALQMREPFDFELRRAGHRLELIAQRNRIDAGRPHATYSSSSKDKVDLRFEEIADGRYRANWPVDRSEEIRVLASSTLMNGTSEFRLVAPADSDRAAETQTNPREAVPMARLSQSTGGVVASLQNSSGFRPIAGGGAAPLSARPLWPWVLLAALLTYLAEILFRRRPSRRFVD